MKDLRLFLLLTVGFFIMTTVSCTKDKSTTFVTYKKFTPIYMTLAEMNAESEIQDAQSMKKTGKIFVYGDYIFINEVREGVHVIDNANPSNPVNVSFIKVPGNIDIAVKGHLLFLDSYFDLLTFDISDPAHPQFVSRAENAFPNTKYRYSASRNAYLVGQLEEIVTEEMDSEVPEKAGWRDGSFWVVKDNASGGGQGGGSGGGGSTGPVTVAGSMASMVVVDDYLYIISGRKVLLFSAQASPSPAGSFEVGFRIETLFPAQNKLFIGGSVGMYIYDNSDPLNPVKLSQFMHFNSCDPVFVKGDIAYVTLRDGTPCQGAQNQLDVIDISNLQQPKLLKEYPMYNPHGLSVDDNQLYLCDGGEGLKVFEISDLQNITAHLKYAYKGIDAYDVIRMPNKDLLIVIGKGGLYQFDISNADQIQKVSFLSTNVEG